MSPIPRTVHEPDDVFVKEFYRHPAWSGVIQHLEKLALDYKLMAAESTPDTLLYAKGRYEGMYEALAAIRTLLNKGT
jgi:hypothetical protein